jgi:hypothetical protein
MRREVPAYTAARGVVLASPLKIIRQSLPMAPGASPALLCLFFLILGSPQGRLAVAAALGPAPRRRATAPGGPGRIPAVTAMALGLGLAREKPEKPRADPRRVETAPLAGGASSPS